MPDQPPTPHLNPSELGTKEYWDTLYNREFANHAEDGEDEGTIWFDESNAEATVISELAALADQGLLNHETSSFLDLGTGNGHMLFALRYPDEDGDDDEASPWTGEMVGVDYSAASVDLARRIGAQRRESTATATSAPRFETWDLLTQPPGAWLLKDGSGTFDCVLDKGTFDAISLMPTEGEGDGEGEGARHPCVTYREKVTPLVREGGFLVVTSCNWTRDELIGWLAAPPPSAGGDGGSAEAAARLELFGEAKYPSFTFGGRKGQSVVTLIFRGVVAAQQTT